MPVVPAAHFSGTAQTCGCDPGLEQAVDATVLATNAREQHQHRFGLGAQGAFADAVRFANSGTAANREAWLNAAFIQWGQNQPQQALAACSGIDNAALRQTAIDGLFLGWSQADPAGLASYALQLTDERERATGLSQALTQWIDHDPAAASHWLDRFEPRPEFDSGMLMLATLPTLIAKRPEVAVDWARSIADPAIQAGALRTIAQQWAERDIAGAQRFAANSGPLCR